MATRLGRDVWAIQFQGQSSALSAFGNIWIDD